MTPLGKSDKKAKGSPGETNWSNQTIWTGDNLPIMRGMNSACVDLIYLDPPFNSKTDYAAPIGSQAAGAAFRDTWTLADIDVEWINLIESRHPALYRVLLAAMTDNDKSYLVYMAARLLEMQRILKPTGAIYLHCDPTMSHYLKLVMDAVFGRKNLRNEIIWCYSRPSAPKQRQLSRVHDTIYWYSCDQKVWTFNAEPIRQPYAKSSRLREAYAASASKMATGSVQLDARGKFPESWIYIPPLKGNSQESTGYPTQKPLALLKRIILASSNEGDVVLDPFCGCATACIAAEIEHRHWAGIDISPKAAELVQTRMGDELGMFFKGAHRQDIPKRSDLGRLSHYNSADNKKYLYGEQGGHCKGCGTHFGMPHLEVDHIIARKKGGTDHIENLQLLCSSCNRIQGDRGMEYLRSKLQITA